MAVALESLVANRHDWILSRTLSIGCDRLGTSAPHAEHVGTRRNGRNFVQRTTIAQLS